MSAAAPVSHLDVVITAEGVVFIHELATERAVDLGLGTVERVLHCRHSLDGHRGCSKGMRTCADLARCPFADGI